MKNIKYILKKYLNIKYTLSYKIHALRGCEKLENRILRCIWRPSGGLRKTEIKSSSPVLRDSTTPGVSTSFILI